MTDARGDIDLLLAVIGRPGDHALRRQLAEVHTSIAARNWQSFARMLPAGVLPLTDLPAATVRAFCERLAAGTDAPTALADLLCLPRWLTRRVLAWQNSQQNEPIPADVLSKFFAGPRPLAPLLAAVPGLEWPRTGADWQCLDAAASHLAVLFCCKAGCRDEATIGAMARMLARQLSRYAGWSGVAGALGKFRENFEELLAYNLKRFIDALALDVLEPHGWRLMDRNLARRRVVEGLSPSRLVRLAKLTPPPKTAMWSAGYHDDLSWPVVAPPEVDGFIIEAIATVGAMRRAARALDNCLANCVEACVQGVQRYYLVTDVLTGDTSVIGFRVSHGTSRLDFEDHKGTGNGSPGAGSVAIRPLLVGILGGQTMTPVPRAERARLALLPTDARVLERRLRLFDPMLVAAFNRRPGIAELAARLGASR